MSPAFKSNRETLLFVATLIGFLILPLVLPTSDRARAATFAAVPVNSGPFEYIHRQIFENRSDLDIALIGSSYMWLGLNARTVQNSLSQKLGRETNVEMLGYRWEGQDLGYLILKDLLQHRHVKMAVIYMPTVDQVLSAPHVQLFRVFYPNYDGELFQHSPVSIALALYGDAVLGAPRRALSQLREDHVSPSRFADLNGTNLSATGGGVRQGQFEDYAPEPPAMSPSEMIYSESTQNSFQFLGIQINERQRQLVQMTVDLCRHYGTHLVIVNIPQPGRDDKVIEREMWPRVFGHDVDLIGIPTARLFSQMSDDQIDRLFDGIHLNKNGNAFFTKSITPALLEIYGHLPNSN
jgi:hypothetical protein